VKVAKESKASEKVESKTPLKASLSSDTLKSPPPTASKFSTPSEIPSAKKPGAKKMNESGKKQPPIFSKLERVVATFNDNQNSNLHALSSLYTHNKDNTDWANAVENALKKANPQTKEKIQKYLASKE
jgi:hypothetical protein